MTEWEMWPPGPRVEGLWAQGHLSARMGTETGQSLEGGQWGPCQSFCLEMIRLLPLQMSQKVSGLLEEAKQGLAVVLALLEKRVA